MDPSTFVALVSAVAAIAAALYARDQHRVAVEAHALAIKAQAHAEDIHEANRRLLFQEKRNAVLMAAHTLLVREREVRTKISAAMKEVVARAERRQTVEDAETIETLRGFGVRCAEAVRTTKEQMDALENTPYSTELVEQVDGYGAGVKRQLLEIESMERTLPDLVAPPPPPPMDYTRV